MLHSGSVVLRPTPHPVIMHVTPRQRSSCCSGSCSSNV